MNFKLKPAFLSLFILFVITSCGKKNAGIESLIPDDATAVIAINMQQLMNKMAASGLTAENFVENLDDAIKDSVVKPAKVFWKGADSIGLDVKQPVYIALSMPKEITRKNGIVRILASIADADKFKLFLTKGGSELTKEDGITYGALDELQFGFNGKYLVMLKDVPADIIDKGKQMGSAFPMKNEPEITEAQVKELIKNTFKLKSSKSILENKNYTKLPIGDNDIKIWTDVEYAVAQNKSGGQLMQVFTRVGKDLFTGSSSTTLLNFENGRIAATNQLYFNKEAAAILKNTKSQEIDLSLLQNFSGKDINAIFGFSIHPNMILDVAKFIKADGIMNIALGQKNLNPEDVFGALTGDAVFVVSDLTEKVVAAKTPVDANMAVLIKIKDKSKLQKMLAIPDIAKIFKPEGNIFLMQKDSSGKENGYMGMTDAVMILSPSKTVVLDYLSGTKKSEFDPAILAKLKGKSAGYYLNMNNIAALSGQFKINPQEMQGMDQGTLAKSILGTFKETYMTAGAFTDNYVSTSGYLVLNKNNDNSLGQMIKMGYSIASMFMKSKANVLMGGMDEEPPLEPMKVD